MELDALGFENCRTQAAKSVELSFLWKQQRMSSIAILHAKEQIVKLYNIL